MSERQNIDPAVAALRGWGFRALDAVIDGDAVPGLPGDDLLRLRPWLQPPTVRRPRAAVMRQLAAIFRYGGVPADLSPLQQGTLEAALSGPDAADQQRLGACPGPPQPVADLVLDALGSAAWYDPDLRLHAASRVRSHLRSRIVFAPAALPVAESSHRFFWSLLACAPARPWQRVRRSSPACRLKSAASRLALRPGWAGLWEQWLLARWLSSSRRGGPAAMPAVLARGLVGLPLFREPEAAPVAAWLRERAGLAAEEEIGASALAPAPGAGGDPAGLDARRLLYAALEPVGPRAR